LNHQEKCPCGTNISYLDCCAKSHQSLSNAITSEQLMRSRYSAFVLSNGDYLMNSHHSMTRTRVNKNELVRWAKSMKWIKLEIVDTKDGGVDDETGIVEFKAHFKNKGKKQVLHQRSKFVREFGNWVYFDAE
jgi:SEC-C motif-containing protein